MFQKPDLMMGTLSGWQPFCEGFLWSWLIFLYRNEFYLKQGPSCLTHIPWYEASFCRQSSTQVVNHITPSTLLPMEDFDLFCINVSGHFIIPLRCFSFIYLYFFSLQCNQKLFVQIVYLYHVLRLMWVFWSTSNAFSTFWSSPYALSISMLILPSDICKRKIEKKQAT